VPAARVPVLGLARLRFAAVITRRFATTDPSAPTHRSDEPDARKTLAALMRVAFHCRVHTIRLFRLPPSLEMPQMRQLWLKSDTPLSNVQEQSGLSHEDMIRKRSVVSRSTRVASLTGRSWPRNEAARIPIGLTFATGKGNGNETMTLKEGG
jgi:hypothetical protein